MAIKGIIMDVDGVLTGERMGFNCPDPNPDVIKALIEVKKQGIPISLCTAKGLFAIKKIIVDAGLDNCHIADGGALLIDPIADQILEAHEIETELCEDIIETYAGHYTELYTPEDYIISKEEKGDITSEHAIPLGCFPREVDDLVDALPNEKIVKIIVAIRGEQDKKYIEELFKKFSEKLELNWGMHPIILPIEFAVITKKGVSKESAAKSISSLTGISLSETLGIGDGNSDWAFIKLCDYAGIMGNAGDKLKENAKTRPNYFIGPHVDENGVVKILKHFNLI